MAFTFFQQDKEERKGWERKKERCTSRETLSPSLSHHGWVSEMHDQNSVDG